MRITVTLDTPGAPLDLLVDCDEAAPAQTLLEAVRVETGARTSVPAHAAEPVSATTVADLGWIDGARIAADGTPEPPTPVPTTGLQLRVVCGPDAGTVFALPQGTHELGRSAALTWADHSLSRRHCRLTVGASGVTVSDLGSSNGTFVEGERCAPGEEVDWPLGSLLEIGDSQLVLARAAEPDAIVEPAEPGWRSFLRPPRIRPFHAPPVITVPRAPAEQRRRRFPVIAMVVPLLFGITMAVIMKTPTYLMFGLMSPLMLGANFVSDRRGEAKDHKAAVEEYEAKLAEARVALAEAVTREQQRLREELPDPATAYLTCTGPGRRLWERRAHDEDALVLRVGTTDLPSTITVTGIPDPPEHDLHAVPASVELLRSPVLGYAGPPERIDAALRWALLQLASAHAPRDLAISVVSARAGRDWSWLRWLPHLRPEEAEGPVARIANDPDTRTGLAGGLAGMVSARKAQLAQDRSLSAESFPPHLVVLHGYRELRKVQGVNQLLEDGPSVGVYLLCTDDSERSLPERATASVVLDPANPSWATVRRSGQPTLERVLVDGVGAAWCEQAARAMSSLRDAGPQSDGGHLPDAARLLEVVGLEPPTADAVRARWMLEPRSTRMVIGVGLEGPFSLDLRLDGPHGLVAGTTGAGKTELLQSIIASLAIANRPEELNFVLVDYKGDSAFKDCVRLPHTVGKVNDLDSFLVQRALTSLQAELTHRKNVLAEAQVKDIEDYQLLQAREPHRAPLPRLLLVIDEFAQLVKDQPDFISGLVSIAAVGRSLGIHLLLATQRPTGVVSPEIRANTNLRIALRVNDAADSTDVLNSPEAARISKTHPGRAYARTGAASLQPFQAGRVGGRRPGAVAVDAPPPFLARVPWSALGYAAPQRPAAAKAQEEVSDTDLAALVAAITSAATAEGVPAQRRPWLDPLPERLLWDDVLSRHGALGEPVRGRVPALPFALGDLPAAQRQQVLSFDLDEDGHLLVVAAARSGRSQLLRTLAGSVARLCDPSDVHLYGIDCGSGALNALTALPHTGAVVGRTETERASRILARLGAEMDARQQQLAEHGYADIREQRAGSADPLPHLLVLVDRWEMFVSTLGESDANTDAIIRILREGAGVGVHLVIAGDRSLGTNSRVATLSENKIALQLADKDDYRLLGLNPKQLPDRLAPGRGFTSRGAELQVLLLSPDESGQGQAAALADWGRRAQGRLDADSRRPWRVDVLPSRAELEPALELARAGLAGGAAPAAGRPLLLVGVGGDELRPYGPDPARASAFVVAGPGRSGRSSVLLGAARSALATGARVLVVAPRPSPLRDLAGVPGVVGVVTEATTPSAAYDEMAADGEGALLVVVDDGEGLRDCGGNEFFLRVVKGQLPGAFLMLGGNAEGVCAGLSGWQIEAKKARQGMLLSPQGLSDGDLIGVARLPRTLLGRAVQPGRGWVNLGDGALVQVATFAPA